MVDIRLRFLEGRDSNRTDTDSSGKDDTDKGPDHDNDSDNTNDPDSDSDGDAPTKDNDGDFDNNDDDPSKQDDDPDSDSNSSDPDSDGDGDKDHDNDSSSSSSHSKTSTTMTTSTHRISSSTGMPLGVSSTSGFFSSITSPPINPATAIADANTSSSHSHTVPIGAIIVIPLFLMGTLIAALAIWRRKRRARREATTVVTREMKMRRDSQDGPLPYAAVVPPGTALSADVPLMAPQSARSASSSTRSPTGRLSPASTRAPSIRMSEPHQPVILNSNMGFAYYSGIDTSDAMSMRSHQAQNHVAYEPRSNSGSDEPPPPYRPRSAAQSPNEGGYRQQALHGLEPLHEGGASGGQDDEIRVADGLRNPFDGSPRNSVRSPNGSLRGSLRSHNGSLRSLEGSLRHSPSAHSIAVSSEIFPNNPFIDMDRASFASSDVSIHSIPPLVQRGEARVISITRNVL